MAGEAGDEDGERRRYVMALPTLALRHSATLVSPSAGDRLVNCSVGVDDELEALWCAGEDWDALFGRGLDWPRKVRPGRTLRPVDVRLTIHGRRETVVRPIESLFLAAPRVRRLPDDRILVVGNTCVWRASGPDRNAVVYDEHGHLDAEETWGDDIFHLAVARDGTVWVGYGSMAIWGTSNGWGDPGPAPPGWRGVIRYEPDALQPIWHYPQASAWGNIDCCYALNVAGDGTWIYYYRNFPIVRITDRGLTGWHNDQVKGAKALAVNDPYIALYGGYTADADVLTVGTLNDDRLEILHQYRVVMPDGTPVDQPTMIGRGATLHTVIGNDWLQLSLTDMLARPPSLS